MGIKLRGISIVPVVPAKAGVLGPGLYVGLAQADMPDRTRRRARQSAAVRQLLAFTLGTVAGDRAPGWALGRLETGQPVLSGRGAPAVSLAHSETWLACAFGRTPALGIDIEVLRPRDWAAAAELVFAPTERDWVLAARGVTRLRRGYRLWTLKEAFAKAVGGAADFAFPDLVLAPDGAVVACPRAYGAPGRWRTRHWWRARQASVARGWRS
jgi:4'-phosphopantetheinyl transferase